MLGAGLGHQVVRQGDRIADGLVETLHDLAQAIGALVRAYLEPAMVGAVTLGDEANVGVLVRMLLAEVHGRGGERLAWRHAARGRHGRQRAETATVLGAAALALP